MELRPGGVGHARTSPTLVVPDELPETTLAETRLDRSQDVWHVLQDSQLVLWVKLLVKPSQSIHHQTRVERYLLSSNSIQELLRIC